jgi:hypothetical protein
MNFQSDQHQLERAFDVLKQQTYETSENWKDSVQKRFYDQFIDTLPKEFSNYINSLIKLDKSFETSKHHIDSLLT